MRPQFKIYSTILAFSLLFGVFFAPSPAKAGFFSSLLGNEASADITDSLNSTETIKNSQTMALLQADVSSIPTTQEKSTKSTDSQIQDNANVNIVSENALLPATNHVSVPGETEAGDSYSDQISVYVIRKGDSISKIADMFDVSANTILLANDMKKGQKLKEGDVLLILPISGTEHTVTKGQTIQSIAKLYKVDVEDITSYNGIPDNAKLAIGDKLMIPGGDNMMTDEGGDKPAADLGSSILKDANYYLTHPIQNLVGYFINPVPTGRKTQGLHGPGNRGIDIGAPTGTPIYASAPGTVLVVKTGCRVGQKRCGGGYGNMAVVQHFNGTRTLYAHMSRLATHIGDDVNRGEIVGYVGNTGRSTGPHVHFEVFNAKNPGSDWSWAN
ncbi:MAG: M23 family metallopeptidase [Candidatus Nomurabacteria bacterium]|nr:M23 family metallopeptidase [Candidatus Nomurabacteria bacterium]